MLGFGFFVRGGRVKVRIDPKARKRAKDRLRQLTSRRWGVSMQRRIAGLNEMEHQGFSSALIKGILLSAEKAAGLYGG